MIVHVKSIDEKSSSYNITSYLAIKYNEVYTTWQQPVLQYKVTMLNVIVIDTIKISICSYS